MRVPYFTLEGQIRGLRGELEAAIGRALDSAEFCLGSEVIRFERAFADYCGAAHAVGFNSGTSALHVAALLMGLGAGDEVITTPTTFVATSWALSYVGARPVFVDIDDATMNLDPALIEEHVTSRTRAVMPVHLYGHPYDADPIREVCRRHGLVMVEDAAQAHSARYRGRMTGTIGDVAGFSFYPGKNLGACGEAGALLMQSEAMANRARRLREHGSSVRYHHDEIGFNYRMEGIQGAVLNVKLRQLPSWTAARRRLAHRYHELLSGTPLKLPREAAWAESVYHLYVVRHAARDRLRSHLEDWGVGTALHYPVPLHLQKCFASLGYRAGDLPVAEQAARECLSLPIYPELTDEQQDHVVEGIRAFNDW